MVGKMSISYASFEPRVDFHCCKTYRKITVISHLARLVLTYFGIISSINGNKLCGVSRPEEGRGVCSHSDIVGEELHRGDASPSGEIRNSTPLQNVQWSSQYRASHQGHGMETGACLRLNNSLGKEQAILRGCIPPVRKDGGGAAHPREVDHVDDGNDEADAHVIGGGNGRVERFEPSLVE